MNLHIDLEFLPMRTLLQDSYQYAILLHQMLHIMHLFDLDKPDKLSECLRLHVLGTTTLSARNDSLWNHIAVTPSRSEHGDCGRQNGR